jgi:hypothetical protein
VMLLPPLLPKSIECKSKAVMQNPAPHGMARHGTASSISPPPYLLLRWRNTRSLLLQPILFCIFGMCSPRRKSAATVWTVCQGGFTTDTVVYLISFRTASVNFLGLLDPETKFFGLPSVLVYSRPIASLPQPRRRLISLC